MRAAQFLAELNDADLLVDGLLARLAQVTDRLKGPAELRTARKALAEDEGVLEKTAQTLKLADAAQKEAASKLERAERALYSGRVRAPKELEDQEKDVGQLRRQLGTAEDRLLEALVAFEGSSEKVNAQRLIVERLSATWLADEARLRSEEASLRTQLSGAQTRQRGVRQAVPKALLTIYDSLRSRRAGRAVAMLDGDSCGACGVAASPGKAEASRYGDELVYCDSCGRILWGE